MLLTRPLLRLSQSRLCNGKIINNYINNNFGHTMSYYAVARGVNVGIYKTWRECERQVKGYSGAIYKKFPTIEEAQNFLENNGCGRSSNSAIIDGMQSFSDKMVAFFKKHGAKGTRKRKYSNDSTNAFKNEGGTDYWPDDFSEDNSTEVDSVLNAAMNTIDMMPFEKKCKLPRHQCKIWQPVTKKTIGRYDFLIDSEDYVIVYTDGSCLGNGKKDACAGFGVYFGENHPLNISEPVSGRATNNVGEIQAAIYAIKTAKHLGVKKLCVSTDSQFMINAMTMWVDKWKCNGWRTKDGDPVKNEIDFKKLEKLITDKSITVKWAYVKAHMGIAGNEAADRLAREGAEMYRRQYLKSIPNDNNLCD